MLTIKESFLSRVRRWFRIMRQAREANRPQYWALTESNGPKHYQFPREVTEAEALAYLRANFANASIDFIDYETFIIFYRLGRRAS